MYIINLLIEKVGKYMSYQADPLCSTVVFIPSRIECEQILRVYHNARIIGCYLFLSSSPNVYMSMVALNSYRAAAQTRCNSRQK